MKGRGACAPQSRGRKGSHTTARAQRRHSGRAGRGAGPPGGPGPRRRRPQARPGLRKPGPAGPRRAAREEGRAAPSPSSLSLPVTTRARTCESLRHKRGGWPSTAALPKPRPDSPLVSDAHPPRPPRFPGGAPTAGRVGRERRAASRAGSPLPLLASRLQPAALRGARGGPGQRQAGPRRPRQLLLLAERAARADAPRAPSGGNRQELSGPRPSGARGRAGPAA